jgi:myo-inositol-1(or 4)-monophosphatase
MASQETIRRILLESFPTHRLLGEEGPAESDPGDATQFRWITDPLDGTTNFVHGVPHYAVSLALEHKGRLLVGAIYDPTRDECFAAASGQGSHLNGQPLHTSQIAQLSEALAASGFPAKVTRGCPEARVFDEALYCCQAVRRTGSASLNMAYLAAGRFDATWAFSTKIWDIAAGGLLVREAGGVIAAPDGGPFRHQHPQYIAAANPELYPQLRQMVARALRDS